MILLLASMAFGTECLDIQVSVDQAYASFNDAETDAARELIQATYQALGCQSKPVSRESLMALYQLDALTALSEEDRQGAVYGIIRAISADPDNAPPESMGPEIAEMHATWSARLKDARLSLSVSDTGETVWLDGQQLVAGETQVVVEGEHVIQRSVDGAFQSAVVDVSVKLSGVAPWNLVVTKQPAVPEPAEIVAKKRPKKQKPPKAPKVNASKGKARLGVTLSGVAVALAGGGVLGWGAHEEMRFSDGAYPIDQFDDAAARESVIRSDAARVNRIYGIGYGLVGVGVITTGVGIFAMPVADGGGVGLRGRW